MATKEVTLYIAVIELIGKKVRSVCSGERPMRDLIELTTLLTASPLSKPEREVSVRMLGAIVEQLSSDGDDRNVRAHLSEVIKGIEAEIEPVANRLGRTA